MEKNHRHRYVDLDDGSRACVACGLVDNGYNEVVEEVSSHNHFSLAEPSNLAAVGGDAESTEEYRTIIEPRDENFLLKALNVSERAQEVKERRHMACVLSYCGLLNIQAYRMRNRIIEITLAAFKLKLNINAELVAVSCIYVVMREENYPVSLREVAILAGMKHNITRLSRVFGKLVRELKLNLPVCEASIFFKKIIDHLIFDTSTKDDIRKICEDINTALKSFWLDQGRRSETIAAAIFCVAIGARRQRRPPAAMFKKVAALISSTANTVVARFDEILEAFNELGKHIPWIANERNSQIFLHIPDIVAHELTHSQSRNSLESFTCPPSFRRSQIRREDLKKRISDTKDRMEAMINFEFEGSAGEDLDELDQQIEALLYQGMSENDILNSAFANQK